MDEAIELGKLVERAAAKDAIKDFNTAAEIYSEATELQAKLNGELSLDNADLLFAYGKALYNVAVSKSDVLGSKVAGETQTQSSDAPAQNTTSSVSIPVSDSPVQDAIASGLVKKETLEGSAQSTNIENKPYFQFTGDENFDDSDSDEADGEQADGVDEDEDDFANAFEVLDLARILYHKKLEAVEGECGKGKSTDLPSAVRHIKERLADTYDLQAEISLEAERFMDAVSDLRTALGLRQTLFSTEDPSVAECHYKLSLALEFGSVHKGNDDLEGDNDGRDKVDEEMREEAATQMEKAIQSCRLRMAQEQKRLSSDSALDEDKVTAVKRKIANVKDIIVDMEQRLIDLRRPPVTLESQDEKSEAMLKGILGQMMGQSPAEQKTRLDAVTKGANDLSAFVKRKPASSQPSQQRDLAQKRSAQEEAQEGDVKRARVGKDDSHA